jgi:hypothetical protein
VTSTHSITTTTENGPAIMVAGLDLNFRGVATPDHSPTGTQIAIAAGFTPNQQVTVLQFLNDGGFEDIRPEENAHLSAGVEFIVVQSDRSFRLTIDGRRVDWPAGSIEAKLVRKLGNVPADKDIYFELQDTADRKLKPDDVIDLTGTGVESFYSRQGTWILNVQGVRLSLHEPTITANDALIKAGFVPAEWTIYLKYENQHKEKIEPSTVIDLTRPGIEKIWLIPLTVDNGEAAQAARQDFALLEVDEDFLNERFAHWETITVPETGRRWLLIYAFQVPVGYSGTRRVTLALEVPPSYPAAQIDMFYVFPGLRLTTGVGLPNTEVIETIMGQPFQRWSRHRGQGAAWKAEIDNVITHLALVESSLRKEVAQ